VPSGELHPSDRRRHRPLVEERRSCRGHGRRRTVPAGGHRRLRGPPTPGAPGGRDHPRLLGAPGTERPSLTPAGRAPRREQQVHHRHAPTVPPPTDTP
jgi:hypothetical protein